MPEGPRVQNPPGPTWLEIDLELEALAGWLHDGERSPQAFSGWLELVSVLEEARARRTAKPSGSAPPPGDAPSRRMQ